MKHGKPLNRIINKLGHSWFNYYQRSRIIRKITTGDKEKWLNALNFLITVLGISLRLLLTRLTVLMLTLALFVVALDYNHDLL